MIKLHFNDKEAENHFKIVRDLIQNRIKKILKSGNHKI